MRRIAYGAACQIVLRELSLLEHAEHTPPPNAQNTLELDELSAEQLARTGFVAVLRAASLQKYSEPVKTVLAMIADMACTSSQESAGDGYLGGTILAYLRDSANGAEELIRQLLSDDKYMEEAQSAIRAIGYQSVDV